VSTPKLKDTWIMDGGQLLFVTAAQNYINYMASDEYHEDRTSNYENDIFESVLIELYGEGVWKWIRERQG